MFTPSLPFRLAVTFDTVLLSDLMPIPTRGLSDAFTSRRTLFGAPDTKMTPLASFLLPTAVTFSRVLPPLPRTTTPWNPDDAPPFSRATTFRRVLSSERRPTPLSPFRLAVEFSTVLLRASMRMPVSVLFVAFTSRNTVS